ncbi:SpoVR family protein [Alkalibacillus silvisoli]|uniref:SpoVR family protein n=1 Tax=Alkalibacillus silvisoli TaxID=392823 RepID=A0ABP3K3Y9_9BACI
MLKYYDALFDASKYLNLSPKPFNIKHVTNEEIKMLQVKGYRKRLTPQTTSPPPSSYIAELYDLVDRTIYVNDQNTNELNLVILAHAIGHSDFLWHNNYLNEQLDQFSKSLYKYRQALKKTIELVGRNQVNGFLTEIMKLFNIIYVSRSDIDWLMGYLALSHWQYQLIELATAEVKLFESIQKTKLMNEGWATFHQIPLLKQANLFNLGVAVSEVEMYLTYPYGLNLYQLGQSLWMNVNKASLRRVMKPYQDYQFIKDYYSKEVHTQEQISYISKYNQINDGYLTVKENLIEAARYGGKIVIKVDHPITESSGYLTLRYENSNVNKHDLNRLKHQFKQLFNIVVYIKPKNSFN